MDPFARLASTEIAAGTSGTEAYTYDSWGRPETRTDGTGNVATTTYDTAGRVATVDDGKGTYTYGYDGTDSRGKKERRGLVTSLDVGLASGPDVIEGAYDANGQLIEQELPGGTTVSWSRDITGVASTMSYMQGGNELLSFSQSYDHLGRVVTAHGPDSVQTYQYDARDRLSRVDDTYQGACSVRTYGFDASSNRTSFKSYAPDTNGDCQDTTTSQSVTSTFDTGDRITTSGYAHDNLGRATAVPAAHTDQPSGSSLAVGYFANDMVASLTQTVPDEESGTVVVKQEFGLDVLGRLAVTKGFSGGVQLSESTAKYAGAGDGAAWTSTKTRPNASAGWTTTWTRNIGDLGGGLGILQSSDGTARLQLSDLRGNVVGSATIGGTAIDSYASYTEYGLARTAVPAEYEGYGWLGRHSRKSAGNVGGVTLMGVRLYNPTTGRFLSRDSVQGGNDNAYVYPPDPINKVDLSGRFFALYNFVKAVVRVVQKIIKINYYKRTEKKKAVGGKWPTKQSGPKVGSFPTPPRLTKPSKHTISAEEYLRRVIDKQFGSSNGLFCVLHLGGTVTGTVSTVGSGLVTFWSGVSGNWWATSGGAAATGYAAYGTWSEVKGVGRDCF